MNLVEKYGYDVEAHTFDGDLPDPNRIIWRVVVNGKVVWERRSVPRMRQPHREAAARAQDIEANRQVNLTKQAIKVIEAL